MKTFSGSARFAGCQSTAGGGFYLALVLGAAMFAAGCGKKSEQPPSSATPPVRTTQDTSQPTAPGSAVNSQPVPVAPATNAASAPPELKQLNRALFEWRVQNRQIPKNFEDFAARANIQIPPPPPGKRYVIDKSGFIKLVDQ